MEASLSTVSSNHESTFTQIASSPWTKNLIENVTVQAGTGYIVTVGNPIGIVTGAATGAATTLGQWAAAKGVEQIAKRTDRADSKGAWYLGEAAKVGAQLAGTGVSIAAQYAISPVYLGVKTAQTLSGYVSGKLAGFMGEKIQDVVGVPKNCCVRPLVNGVLCTSVGMGVAAAIGVIYQLADPSINLAEPELNNRQQTETSSVRQTTPLPMANSSITKTTEA